MYQSKVNDKTYQIEFEKNNIKVNNETQILDIIEVEKQKKLHLIYKNKSYYFEVVQLDKDTNTCLIKHRGKIVSIQIKDKFDLLLDSLGMDVTASKKINTLKAPMPGLVLSTKVKAGDSVKKGDALLILEAMKMENVIKSPTDGVIKTVHIEDKNTVDKNQILITFE